ncbi:MAG: diacylglycerol kinase family lipid kinase [Clostridia bacterium]|nr:diacylglycerol kinase family lipid kinase [Clostridia bacterium]
MRHVFIINPIAGRHDASASITSKVQEYFSSHGGDYEIILTEAPLHAMEIAKREAASGDGVRLYACGGDGTLNEVIRGAFGFENAEIAAVPTGSGNDYIKVFGTREQFLNLPALIEGITMRVDLVRCGERLGCNILSAGFDAEVAYHMARFKNMPLVSGHLAYTLAVFYCLIRKTKNSFEVQIDSEPPIKHDFTLVACLNGICYGGGYSPVPSASVTDGTLDFVLAGTISRLKFVKLLNSYKIGRLDDLHGVITYSRGTKIHIRYETPFAVNIDGECHTSVDVLFEVLPQTMSFVLPKGLVNTRKP